jgi:hypothetical protein
MAIKPIERRVTDLEEMVEDVPRLLNLRFSFVRAQLETLDARLSTVEAKIDALPRVLAQMLDERGKRG